MDEVVLHKAVFLLRDCHESEQQVVERLKEYYPELTYAERERYVGEAWDVVHGNHPAR